MVTARCGVLQVIGIAVVVLTTACGGDDGDGSASAPATSDTAPATTSTTEPEGPAPPELQGDWVATLADGDIAMLTFGKNFFRIERAQGQGGGHIEVEGGTIRFSGTDLCNERAEYTWSITDGSLTLTVVGEDPCGGRADALAGKTFTPAEG
jgi:hypothetical protein